MQSKIKGGIPVVGVIFLALALFKFAKGDPWVVWLILGFLFGGFAIFSLKRNQG